MARKPRLAFEGAIYHVTFRGNERRAIFRDDVDRNRFLDELSVGVEDYEIRLFLWCLMGNHAHMLLETPRANISSFMGSLLTGYSAYFNRRHRRSGHLTQGRFHSPLVEGDRYLLKLSRYIHLNPVFVNRWRNRSLRERLEVLRGYRWSSYLAYAGRASQEPFVEYEPVLRMLDGVRESRKRRYRQYVEAGLAETDAELQDVMRHGHLAIGTETFRQEIHQRYEEEGRSRVRREDISFRRSKNVVEPGQVVEAVCKYFGVKEDDLRRYYKKAWIKPVAATLLVRHAGLTQREVAARMGLGTGSAVCAQLKKVRAEGGRHLRKAIRDLETRLNI